MSTLLSSTRNLSSVWNLMVGAENARNHLSQSVATDVEQEPGLDSSHLLSDRCIAEGGAKGREAFATLRNVKTREGCSQVQEEEVLRTLERILSSALFAKSERLSSFLRFTVEETLKGQAHGIKEYIIGTVVYGRRADFDPSCNTIVRTEARRLRNKLREYYATIGQKDRVEISFPLGGYVPDFRIREVRDEPRKTEHYHSPTKQLRTGSDVRLVVIPFEGVPGIDATTSFAFGLSEELIDRLVTVPGLEVVWGGLRNENEKAQKEIFSGSDFSLSGSVRIESGWFRISIRLTDRRGQIISSHRVEGATDPLLRLHLQEAVISLILSRIGPGAFNHQRDLYVSGYETRMLYSEVLSAESMLESGSLPAIEESKKKFEELIALAPDCARLYSGLSQCCMALAQRGAGTDRGLTEQALDSASKATFLEPAMPDGHASLGCASSEMGVGDC